ncbi:MAG: shikimate dehydrogenase [Homoserinimonas sp.]|nr:shikimate dehydrogenase [Homoserinimonas sp.]MCW5944748.1 shikimate dehydrogenase [Cryobacterium sp.]
MAAHRKLAVLGSPISHSRSPQLHLAAYRELGLDWSYERVELEAHELADFLSNLDKGWLGLSVTMPLKDEARRLADEVDPATQLSGAANTILLDRGQVLGFNTDVYGAMKAVEATPKPRPNRAAILGGGASSRSVLLALSRLGATEIVLLNRSRRGLEALSRLAEDIGIALTFAGLDSEEPEVDLAVSTLPGNIGLVREFSRSFRSSTPLVDLAYEPAPAPLTESWESAGGTVVSGLEMLVHQALAQIRIFMYGDPLRPLDRESRVLAAMKLAAV